MNTTETKTTDIEYKSFGLFTSFYANTPHGESAWRELATQTEGTGKVLTVHSDAVVSQLRAAGYTVSPARLQAINDADLNDLAAEIRHNQSELDAFLNQYE